MLMFQELPDLVVTTIYEFSAMKDEFKNVLDELETRYDDGKWWCYRHRPQRPMRNTRKEPFPDRYGRRRAVRFTTDEDNLVSQQYWRKRRMLTLCPQSGGVSEGLLHICWRISSNISTIIRLGCG